MCRSPSTTFVARPFPGFRVVEFSELTALPPTDAQRLEDAGVEDLAALAIADPTRVATILGRPENEAAGLVRTANRRLAKELTDSLGPIDLQEIDDVGPSRADSLTAAGITHPVQVALGNPKRIANIIGVNDGTPFVLAARKVINEHL